MCLTLRKEINPIRPLKQFSVVTIFSFFLNIFIPAQISYSGPSSWEIEDKFRLSLARDFDDKHLKRDIFLNALPYNVDIPLEYTFQNQPDHLVRLSDRLLFEHELLSLKFQAYRINFDTENKSKVGIDSAQKYSKPAIVIKQNRRKLINPGILDSKTISMRNIKLGHHWDKVLNQYDRFKPREGECGDQNCQSDNWTAVAGLIRSAKNQTLHEKLSLVNSGINHIISYRSDRENYGPEDYWASAEETLDRGTGDCEDYAITKYMLLKFLGISDEAMQLVVVKDLKRRLYHAVLAVHDENNVYLLDNNSPNLLKDSDADYYMPMFSFSGAKKWIHGFAASRQIALNKDDFAGPIIPGGSAKIPN